MARKWSIFFYRVKSLLKQVVRRGGGPVGGKHFGDKLSQKLKAVLSKCFARAQLRYTPRPKGRITFIILALLGFISTQAVPAISAQRENILPDSPLGKTCQISLTSNALGLAEAGLKLYQAGKIESAIECWEKVAEIYDEMGDRSLATEILLNKAAAEQRIGHYPRSYKTIVAALDLDNSAGERSGAMDLLTREAKTLNKARGLRLLGEYFQQTGKLELSSLVLQEGREVAEALGDNREASAAIVSLGNTARAIGNKKQTNVKGLLFDVVRYQKDMVSGAIADYQPAIEFYEEAARGASAPLTKIQAKLNHLSLLLEIGEIWEKEIADLIKNKDEIADLNDSGKIIANSEDLRSQLKSKISEEGERLSREIESELENLPSSRAAIYGRIKLAQSLKALQEETLTIAQLLATAANEAENLGDPKAQSYALGNLGTLYEENGRWDEAELVTESAIRIASASVAPEIAYQWQWQLGRILVNKEDREGAIAAYDAAFNTLKSLRDDLAASDRNIKFSFRDRIAPLYRQYVSLLLRSEADQKDLEKARQVLEQLQIAELDNFFGDPCSEVADKLEELDQVDKKAAVIYPIILADRLEVILKLPEQDLQHYATLISRKEVEEIINQLRRQVEIRPTQQSRDYLSSAQDLYNLLIGPAAADLKNSTVETLVFVLDGPLRNIPMAALHDGQGYLIEKYNLALTTGLELRFTKPLQPEKIKVLAAGVTDAVVIDDVRFPKIPQVATELNNIEGIFNKDPEVLRAEVLRQEEFTQAKLEEKLKESAFPVVHLATHGRFGSNPEDTFIITGSDEPGSERIININELEELLETSDGRAIELLVLSACETAAGDDRAPLGLAGVAVRAGARSTIATLWLVNDKSTAELMDTFYNNLVDPNISSKVEALREAQRKLLDNPQYNHPYYWAPFVLVGNWL